MNDPPLPASRRNNFGVYLHKAHVADPKLSSFLLKMVRQITYSSEAADNDRLFAFLEKHHKRLAKEIEGKRVSEM